MLLIFKLVEMRVEEWQESRDRGGAERRVREKRGWQGGEWKGEG